MFENSQTYKMETVIDTVIDNGDPTKILAMFLHLWRDRKLITEEHHNASIIQIRTEMECAENVEAMRVIREAAALIKQISVPEKEPSNG